MRGGPRLKPGSILEDALATFDVTSALPDGWRRDREADEFYRPQNAGVALNRRHRLRSVFATAIWSRACQPVTVPMAR